MEKLDFQRILELLETHRVDYVVVGGVAMALQGSSHVTLDLDLAYSRQDDNLTALVAALADLHPRLRGVDDELPFRWDRRTLAAGLNFTLSTDAGAVDTLGQIAGVKSYADLRGRALEIELGNLRVPVACLEDLIAMKTAANRPKDRNHLLELRALLELRS